MKEITFTDKVWISQKKKLHKLPLILCILYLIIAAFAIIINGASYLRVFHVFVAITLIFLWVRARNSRIGSYEDTVCKIVFSDGSVRWEYPDITLKSGPNSHIVYTFNSDDIKNITIEEEKGPVIVECSPVVEFTRGNTHNTTDFRKTGKSIVITAHNCDVNELEDLFRQYTGKTISREY